MHATILVVLFSLWLHAEGIPITHTTHSQPQLTLQEHLLEMRSRLFWIVAWLVVASLGGYLIKDQVLHFLMAPLNGQSLVYLTPIGGFNFIFRVCVYFGLAVVVPVIMYQLFRFLEPLMQQKRSVVAFLFFSVLLALSGGLFAYFATLPASLNFLLSFDIQQVKAMLTVESYLSFVVTYVLGFAVLFQIPLLLMIFNNISPLPPSKLMGLQRYIVVAAFVIAAIISPTPDATNQFILAAPIVAMYELGVLLVWLQNRMHLPRRKPGRASRRVQHAAVQPKAFSSPALQASRVSALSNTTTATPTPQRRPVNGSAVPAVVVPKTSAPVLSMDIGFRVRPATRPDRVIVPAAHGASRPARPLLRTHRSTAPTLRAARLGSIDGMRGSRPVGQLAAPQQ